MPIYKIADLYVDMSPDGELLRRQAKPYLAKEEHPADITINVRREYVDEQVKRLSHLTYEECEYLIFGAAFYHKLIDHDGFMLHSSAVVYDGQAYLFSGSCGAGKSTHTSLWIKHFGEDAFIINDDKPAIRKTENGFLVYGTPFSGKTDTSRNTSAPPVAVCFVKQGEKNSIVKLSTDEAVPFLLEQTTRSASGARGDNLFGLLDMFLRSYPTYQLTCTISTEAVLLAHNTMSKKNID